MNACKRWSLVDMRLQLVPAINNCALINDSYSFDIASFAVALDFMQQQNQFNKKQLFFQTFRGLTNRCLCGNHFYAESKKHKQASL